MNCVKISGAKSISSLPVVRGEKQLELLKRVAQGDFEARKELIEGSLRLVVSIVSRFFNGKGNADDLFQTGCIGLIKAVDNYDVNRDVTFSSYATKMIFGEIQNYIRRDRDIHVSRILINISRKILVAKEKFIYEYHREPTSEEIAKLIKLPVTEVNLALGILKGTLSLHQLAYEDVDGIVIEDIVEDVKADGRKWIHRLSLNDGLHHLTPRERRVLERRYFADKTQPEVAQEFGMSQSQVCKDEKRALEKMKVYIV